MIYVDKTDLIYRLAAQYQKFFLARPRRFGKSLLVSAFASLFKFGLRDFKGLAIESLWRDSGSYVVIQLDFSNAKGNESAVQFKKKLSAEFRRAFRDAGETLPAEEEELADNFAAWLSRKNSSSVVLLIDEYDAPLTESLDDPALFEAVRRELASVYARVKLYEGKLRFFFMTGITKFNKAGIFSELNNLTDISLVADYGTLLGYTEEELRKYFSGYIGTAAEVLGMTPDNVIQEMTAHYDGHCFDRLISTHVFAPWSVLSFLASPREKFLNYWFSSGGRPSVLLKYFKQHALKDPTMYLSEKSVSINALSGSSDLDSIDDMALLVQAGYLTLKGIDGGEFILGYPNAEVAESMAVLYSELLLDGRKMREAGVKNFADTLAKKPAADVIADFNRLFASIDYRDYPISSEAAARTVIQVLLAGAMLSPRIEVHGALGRSDLEVDAGGRRWVFEFKFLAKEARDQEKAATALLEAARNQILSKRYGEHGPGERELVRIGLVFSEAERQIVHWQNADAPKESG